MNSLLVHGHKICPLAKITFSFPTEKGGKTFFYCIAGAHATLQGSTLEWGGCDATFTTTLINEPANAAMEWNIAIRPECKWRVVMCLWAPSELGWAAVVAEQEQSELCLAVMQTQALWRWAAAGNGKVSGARSASFKGASGSTPAGGGYEKPWGWVGHWVPLPFPCSVWAVGTARADPLVLRFVFPGLWVDQGSSRGKGNCACTALISPESANPYMKDRSSLLLICAVFVFEGTCILQGSHKSSFLTFWQGKAKVSDLPPKTSRKWPGLGHGSASAGY